MRKIVIANQKGGVGKTTTAINLASGLALKGRSTLVIDMDPQANATFAILGSQKFDHSTYDLLLNDLPIAEVIQQIKQENLDIVPSHIDLAGAEVELISRVGGQVRLRTKLTEAADELDERYDYIIIDAPPSLGFLTINSLAAADEIFIPVSTSVFALNGIAMLEDTIRQVRRELNCPDLHISGVLCAMYDHTNVAKDVVSETRSHFEDLVFQTVIPRNVKLEEAHSREESIFSYAGSSKGAEAYRQLVQEVINCEQQ
jgi:chromosome partitioning protein